jgi:hypothetical protein
MGASSFTMYAKGKNLSDAYERAVENATREYGDDPYNGTISTTNGFTDLTQDFKRSKKEIYAYIDQAWDSMNKRDCGAICLEEPKGNTNKVKSQVDHIVTPGTKKWVLKYVVRKYNGYDLSSHATKGDAVKAARTYTEKTQDQTTIHMVKQLEKCSDQVAKITYKKSTSEKEGRWILFGWAAE